MDSTDVVGGLLHGKLGYFVLGMVDFGCRVLHVVVGISVG